MQDISNLKIIALALSACLLAACGRDSAAAKVEALTVIIDADSNCSLEGKTVECARVGDLILARHPGSKPRIDICLQKETHFGAAKEVMSSVVDAGFHLGNFDCRRGPG